MKTKDILLGITVAAVGVIIYRRYHQKDASVKIATSAILPETLKQTTIFEKLDVKQMTPQKSLQVTDKIGVSLPTSPDSAGLKPVSAYTPTEYFATPGILPKEVYIIPKADLTTFSKPWLTNQ